MTEGAKLRMFVVRNADTEAIYAAYAEDAEAWIACDELGAPWWVYNTLATFDGFTDNAEAHNAEAREHNAE